MYKIKSLTKIFILNALDFKAMFIMTLLLPVIFMYWNNNSLIGKTITNSQFFSLFFGYSAFISVMHVVTGNNLGLLYYRENGFFKMFKYITGNKYIVILASFIAQYFTLLISLIIFSTICSLSFKPSMLFTCIIITIISFLFITIPISLFFLWLPLLNVRPENISPFITIFILILAGLASIKSDSVLMLINPIYLYSKFSSIILNLISNKPLDIKILSLCLIIALIYILIGFISARNIKVNSVKNRV